MPAAPPTPSDELGEGTLLPAVLPSLQGPRTRALLDALADSECPGLTARRARRHELSGAPHDPIVIRAARGANLVDVDGNRFVDLVGGFGAALLGHTHPAVMAAVQAQSSRLLHALGDVYPSEEKIRLEVALAARAPWKARVILGLSGADAVEAALKTARLATGRPGVLAFHGGYHGLSYGSLALCGYKPAFRAPFDGQLNPAARFAEFASRDRGDGARALDAIENTLRCNEIGAVLVEPIQGRGGVVIPPDGFLASLGSLASRYGALLIADEIYTGLGRVGSRYRSVEQGLTPDIVCLGKALGGGLPVSACLMREEVAMAWGSSTGEALHTSTFLGNPLSCSAALASLALLDAPETAAQIARASSLLHKALSALSAARAGRDPLRLRAASLLVGVEVEGGLPRVLAVVRGLLERGFITLPGGVEGDTLTLTPPMCLTAEQCDAFAAALDEVLDRTPPGRAA